VNKAETFYLQSLKHDLTRLKDHERLQRISADSIAEYIQ
jgi:hypothetical protein